MTSVKTIQREKQSMHRLLWISKGLGAVLIKSASPTLPPHTSDQYLNCKILNGRTLLQP